MGLEEGKVESHLVKMMEQEGYLCLKFTSPGINGVPDRIILAENGRIYFVEVKAPGEKPRKLQLKIASWFRELGHHVFVIDTKEDAAALAIGISAGRIGGMVAQYGAHNYK